MELFVGPRPEKHEINHKDGNKTNNSVANLEYVTCSENNRHAFRTGLSKGPPRKDGTANHNSKFTQRQVAWIRKRHGEGESIAALSRELGVTTTCIGKIVRRQSYKTN